MALPDRVFVCGYPGEVGGANTELWHTIRLWRRFGLAVTLIPTWQADARWRTRLTSIGCDTVEREPDRLHEVPGLVGGVVVAMCNTRFLAAAARFRELGCRIVWVGCMNWLFPRERMHYREYGPFDRHVFQSRYQRDQLLPQLRRFDFAADQGRLIRGAFQFDEFPFRPRAHARGERLIVGRISRAAPDKFSPQTWHIYARTPHPIQARVLGFSREVETRLGPPPSWATCLAEGSETPREFFAGLHAMVHTGGRAVENWPRVGLEAMAAGVPVVAEARGGWKEMIRHGQTGYLCDNDDEFAYYTARLAYDEPHRRQMLCQARCAVEEELARPESIWSGWRELLGGLG